MQDLDNEDTGEVVIELSGPHVPRIDYKLDEDSDWVRRLNCPTGVRAEDGDQSITIAIQARDIATIELANHESRNE